MVTCTVLAARQFRYFYALITTLTPPTSKHNVTVAYKIFRCVTLRFPNGGLVIARHIEICDKIIQLKKQAFPPNVIYGKALTQLGRSISEEDLRHGSESPRNTG